ncbi:MAG: hypothetical protein H6726_22435 [Sandaracinaceae bacterium]|nr:hypothetical protein [Sandaracinaceae bacterium]
MSPKARACSHDWGSASGLSRCGDCGALGSYFPGGDRGEPAYRGSVPGEVVARAARGEVDELVAALPAFRNGAWWLTEADWAKLLTDIHADLDAWRAAFARSSGDVAFFDRAIALKQLAHKGKRAPTAKPDAVVTVALEGRLALDAVGRGFTAFALDAGGAVHVGARGAHPVRGVGNGTLYRAGPGRWVEDGAAPTRRLHRFGEDGSRLSTADLPGQGDPTSTGALVSHTLLTNGHEAYFVGFPPPPLTGECALGWIQVRDAHDTPIATWRSRGGVPLRTARGYVSFHDVDDGESHPVTLRDHELHVLARSAPGPYFRCTRFLNGSAPGSGEAIAVTPGPKGQLEWVQDGERLVARPRHLPAPRPTPTGDLSFHAVGDVFHGEGGVGFVPDTRADAAPTWRETGTLVGSASRGPHVAILSEDRRRVQMVHARTGERAPWVSLDAPLTTVRSVGTSTGVRFFADRHAFEISWGQPHRQLGALPKPLRPVAHFVDANITTLVDESSGRERYLCLASGDVVAVPAGWELLGPHDHRWGPVFRDGNQLLIFGPWPTL